MTVRPVPIPAIAPAERLSDVVCATTLDDLAVVVDGMRLMEPVVLVEVDVVLLGTIPDAVLADAEDVEEGMYEAVEVLEGSGDSVETTWPLPFRMTPS